MTFSTIPAHVAIGAGAQFFPNPQQAIKKCISFLNDGGFLLASPFYIINPIPEDLLNLGRNVFGITPTTAGYKARIRLYTHVIGKRQSNEQCLDKSLYHDP